MTMPLDVTKRCFICGTESTHEILASSNTFGGTPDLDTRPPEMLRSTMHWWIQECPHCGYVATSLENPTSVTNDFLNSQRYTTCEGRSFQYSLANKFYKDYLIRREDQDSEGAFAAALNATWACDDYDTADNAIHCRLMALEQLEKLLIRSSSYDELFLIHADLLRRTGQFQALVQKYTPKHFENPLFNKIIAFQLEKAKMQDTACYCLKEIPNYNR